MRFAWRTKTIVWPDQKVAMTEQLEDCQANSKVVAKQSQS